MTEKTERMLQRARVVELIREAVRLERARVATIIEHAVIEARAAGWSPLLTLEKIAARIEAE